MRVEEAVRDQYAVERPDGRFRRRVAAFSQTLLDWMRRKPSGITDTVQFQIYERPLGDSAIEVVAIVRATFEHKENDDMAEPIWWNDALALGALPTLDQRGDAPDAVPIAHFDQTIGTIWHDPERKGWTGCLSFPPEAADETQEVTWDVAHIGTHVSAAAAATALFAQHEERSASN